MKQIKINEYCKSMGTLIDVQHPIDYKNNHYPDSINIYYEKLIYNHKKYLRINSKYFITCSKGKLSKKTVEILSYYGYDVTQVII